MPRPYNDYKVDYHIEYVPVRIPPRLPQRPEVRQHPESDANFIAATFILEICSTIYNECDDCPLLDKCASMFSGLAKKGCDKPLTKEESEKFVKRYIKMIRGERKSC